MTTEQADRTTEAAAALFEARQAGKAIPPVSQTFGILDPGAAYAIQSANTRHWLGSGRRLAGRKIGLTSRAVQQQLGVDQPDYGTLFADGEIAEGQAAPRGLFIQPRVEAEIAFVLGRDLNQSTPSLSDVIGAIDHALPAIEIVDSAIADWKITLADTIADNASAGGFILGASPRRLCDLDLRLCGMVLSRRGEAVSTGLGAACLGNPLHAALWLARTMSRLGEPLRAGEVVLSGALGPMVPAAPGDRFLAEIQGFSPFELAFEA